MLPDAFQLRGLQDRLADDLLAFAPEIILAGTIVVVLFARLIKPFDGVHRVTIAIVAAVLALRFVIIQWLAARGGTSHGEAFTGLLNLDSWAAWFRGFILAATLLVLILSRITELADREDSGDFAVLLLGAALGLMLMASANHLLMVFLAIEMASLPSYALAGFLKGRSTGSEAALKYVIFGAAASGVMLYGISLLTARIGTGYLPSLAKAMNAAILHGGFDLPLAAGLLFLAVGLGYKLSVVPFHVWLPDVFEGSAAEIGAFLSVASKAAALGLTGRLLMLQGHSLDPAYAVNTLGVPLAIIGAITATFGNLMAYAQTNLKRLLGYSTIAHAGFLLASLGPMTGGSFAATLVYLVAYLFANIGAFAIVAAVRTMTGTEEIASLGGLMKQSPALGIAFALFVLSLLGLPPLAGFAGKFLVFETIYQAHRDSRASTIWLIVFGTLLVNTAIGAGYYLKLLRVAVLDETAMDAKRPVPTGLTLFAVLLAACVVLLGIFWSPALESATAAISSLK